MNIGTGFKFAVNMLIVWLDNKGSTNQEFGFFFVHWKSDWKNSDIKIIFLILELEIYLLEYLWPWITDKANFIHLTSQINGLWVSIEKF